MENRILFINRKQKHGRKSIEKVFNSILKPLDKSIYLVKEISFHAWFVCLRHQSIHLTGDIYWFSLFLFWKNISMTYHDIGHYKSLSGLKKHIYFYFWLAIPIIISEKISVVSNETRKDIEAVLRDHFFLKKMANKIHTIPNPITICDDDKLYSNENYLLVVGTRPNKRLDLCIRVAAIARNDMVIVGELSKDDLFCLKKANINYKNYIDVDDTTLSSLYKKAFCLLFLSDHEGFGLPIVESQYLGVPVVCNDIYVLRETGGDGALYVDNRNVFEVIRTIRRLSDEKFRKYLINKGRINASMYDPLVVSSKYLEFFNS